MRCILRLLVLVMVSGACSAGATPTGAEDASSPSEDAPVDESGAFVDPFAGASGCDGGVAITSQTCQVRMPVSGGIDGVLSSDPGCGWSDVNFGVNVRASPPWESVAIRFAPSQPFVPGRTGSLGSVAVALSATAEDGAVGPSWVTPPECTLEISSNVCGSATGPAGVWVVSGTGSCPVPAEALHSDEDATPVTIEGFWFVAEYTPENG
jgi:hypothetical protein